MGVKGASHAPKTHSKPANKSAGNKSVQGNKATQSNNKTNGTSGSNSATGAKSSSDANKTNSTSDPSKTNSSQSLNSTDKADKTSKTSNDQDMQSSKLSDREKEIQKDLDKGEVNIKDGDKLGNFARAKADADKNGELSQAEKDNLPAITKALLDKNPELAKLAKDQGIDPADPNNTDKLMQMDLTDKDGKPLATDKVKIPSDEEVDKAKKETQQSDQLPNEDPVKADHIGGNCNKNHDKDIIAQMSEKLQEGDKLASEGKASEAAQAYNEVLSLGSQALQAGGAADGGKGQNGPMDYANKGDLNKDSKLKSENPQAYNQAVQSLSSSKPEVKEAVNKLQSSPDQRIQKVVDLMASAEAKLEKQKKDGQNDVKKQTNGDPKAQQGQLTANNYKAPKINPPTQSFGSSWNNK